VVASFDGGAIASDTGALLLGAKDRATGLVDRFASCFRDARSLVLIEHEVRTLVGQRVFGQPHRRPSPTLGEKSGLGRERDHPDAGGRRPVDRAARRSRRDSGDRVVGQAKARQSFDCRA
jgi:hypothetical protein